MEKPDKIYIQTAGIVNGFFGLAWIDNNFATEPIEYIRKDALLEWAKKVTNDTNHSLAYRGAYRDLINKLNSL